MEPLQSGDPRAIGSYEILGRLGHGGMGWVYLGRAVNTTSPYVAVKVIAPDVADFPQFRARFAREAEAAKRVARFCTAGVLEVDVGADRPYLVTEFIDGPTLADQVETNGPLAPADVERLAHGLANALVAIHAQLIHRDLKPSNVMLSPLGIRVIDFGIARALDEDTTSGWPGTPAFKAPEQANHQTVTRAADIHAWGAVVLFAATGRYAFGPKPTVRQIMRQTPDLSGVPDTLRPLVERAMSKDPARRPTAPELRDQVTRSLHVAAEPTVDSTKSLDERDGGAGPPGRVAVPRRRSSDSSDAGTFFVIALIFAALVAGFVFWGSGDSRESTADMLAKHTLTLVGKPLVGNGLAVLSVAFSKDGKTLATGGNDGTIRLWSVSDPAHTRPLAQPLNTRQKAVPSIALSSDSKTLATASLDSTVILWDITDPTHAQEVGALLPQATGVDAVAISPDGSTLAIGDDDGTVELWNIHDRTAPKLMGHAPNGKAKVVSLAFSPDGKTLAGGEWDHSVHLWDLTDRKDPKPLGRPLLGHTNVVWSVLFTPNGHTLVTGSADRTVRLWDIANRASPRALGTPLMGADDAVWCAAISADGTLIAAGSAEG
jgi:WD40 repeat protein